MPHKKNRRKQIQAKKRAEQKAKELRPGAANRPQLQAGSSAFSATRLFLGAMLRGGR